MSSLVLLHVSYLLSLQHLFITATTASPTDIWHVSIWEAPAPPPGEGPPLSDHSLRDLSYLPAQIASIIGAYVLSVLIIGSAILFVGRRLRRAAQASPGTLSMEMMKPVKHDVPKAFDPSPISPSTNNLYGPSPNSTIDMKNNWPSPQSKSARDSDGWGSIAKGHRKQPSVVSSVVTFDESVIEDDKERNQKEMERLYAAVMEHDEKKSASVSYLPDEQRPQSPPELQHLRSPQKPSEPPPRSDTISPTRTATKSPRTASRPTPLSIHSRNSSRSSLGSFSKKRGIRSLPISPPMGSPDLVPSYNARYGEAEPLTPRVYDDPGPPPLTPPQRKASQSRDNVMDASRLSPRSTRFQEPSIPSIRAPRTSIPAAPGIQTIPETPGRPEMQSRNSDRSKTKRTPAPLALRTQALVGSGPGSSSSAHHPLRSAPLPLRNQHPTNHNSDRPPSMIKATVLERKLPNVPSLRTPMTGVPMTPYSPYMPRTPLTPMTPSRLVTRAERKRREKEEGRKVATIDDAVEEEADITRKNIAPQGYGKNLSRSDAASFARFSEQSEEEGHTKWWSADRLSRHETEPGEPGTGDINMQTETAEEQNTDKAEIIRLDEKEHENSPGSEMLLDDHSTDSPMADPPLSTKHGNIQLELNNSDGMDICTIAADHTANQTAKHNDHLLIQHSNETAPTGCVENLSLQEKIVWDIFTPTKYKKKPAEGIHGTSITAKHIMDSAKQPIESSTCLDPEIEPVKETSEMSNTADIEMNPVGPIDNNQADIKPFNFLGCPDKVRQRILQCIFRSDKQIKPHWNHGSLEVAAHESSKENFTNILPAFAGNKELIDQATAILYGENIFNLRYAKVSLWWLKRIGSNISKLRRLKITVTEGVADNFGTREETLWSSIFHLLKEKHNLQSLYVSFAKWSLRTNRDDGLDPNEHIYVWEPRYEVLRDLLSFRGLERAVIMPGPYVAELLANVAQDALILSPGQTNEDVLEAENDVQPPKRSKYSFAIKVEERVKMEVHTDTGDRSLDEQKSDEQPVIKLEQDV